MCRQRGRSACSARAMKAGLAGCVAGAHGEMRWSESQMRARKISCLCRALIIAMEGRDGSEKVLWPQVDPKSSCPIEQQLLAVSGYEPIGAPPLAWVGPATNAQLAAAGHGGYGGYAAANSKDCVCRFHGRTLRQSQCLGNPPICDFRNFSKLRYER